MRHSGYEDTNKYGAAGANRAAASFYIRGPQPKGWHLGQKQVPRFCVYLAGYS